MIIRSPCAKEISGRNEIKIRTQIESIFLIIWGLNSVEILPATNVSKRRQES
ncbi:hypothetical protein VS868_15630 [Salinimicrobium sp. 3283s]|uniref:hypothetical protein n=1 Tax=Salinimicrobium sp. 3283s TaxID=3114359 RepID=UPI0031EAD3C1